MNWINLRSEEQISEIIEKSKSKPCLIFKHSSRCSISSVAKHRVERQWDFDQEEVAPYYLDLINYRSVSNEISSTFGVRHESPQVLLIQNGQCVFNTSHLDISVAGIRNGLQPA